MNYTETESKVREATNDDPWGPSGQLMGEIARQVEGILMFDLCLSFLWTLSYVCICRVTLTSTVESLLRLAYFLFRFRATFMYEQFPEVMNMLWTRMLKDNKKNWRRVYKVCFTDDCTGLKWTCFGVICHELDCHLYHSLYCCWRTWSEMDLNGLSQVQENTCMTCVQLRAIIT